MAARRKKARARAKPQAPPPAPPPPSEFATWQATLTPRERRIDEVRSIMAQGRWMAGVSHRQFAEKWGVSPGTVEHIALEANRLLRFVFRTDKAGREDSIALIRQTFEVIRVRGMLMQNSPAGLRVALDATERLGRYLGLEPPQRVAMVEPDEFEGKSDAELEAIASGKVPAGPDDAADAEHASND